jgi:rhodanese-related sulfurtransferase
MESSYLGLGIVGAFAVLLMLRGLRRRSVPRVSAEEAAERLKRGEAVLLDVRAPSEYRSSHIKGSISIPAVEMRRRLDEVKRKGQGQKEIICYCNTGNRSVNAAALLRGKGLNASSLDGGIGEWNFVHRQR